MVETVGRTNHDAGRFGIFQLALVLVVAGAGAAFHRMFLDPDVVAADPAVAVALRHLRHNAPFAIFFTSAYFYGFAFIDYAIERKRFNVRQSVRYVNKNIGLVTGIGTVFALALMIPALSLAACCFVSLLSVIAGTIAVERMNDKSVK